MIFSTFFLITEKDCYSVLYTNEKGISMISDINLETFLKVANNYGVNVLKKGILDNQYTAKEKLIFAYEIFSYDDHGCIKILDDLDDHVLKRISDLFHCDIGDKNDECYELEKEELEGEIGSLFMDDDSIESIIYTSNSDFDLTTISEIHQCKDGYVIYLKDKQYAVELPDDIHCVSADDYYDFGTYIEKRVQKQCRKIVHDNIKRIAELGDWPKYIDLSEFVDRYIHDPEKEDVLGIPDILMIPELQCALDIIPRDKQWLIAELTFHSEKSILQVREDINDGFLPDAATTWWLAARNTAVYDGYTCTKFLEAAPLSEIDYQKRVSYACAEFEEMRSLFRVIGGIPQTDSDDGILAMYICGYNWGVKFDKSEEAIYVRTFRESLGLESFYWSDQKNEQGEALSGPVKGSLQNVRCCNLIELGAALSVVQNTLGKSYQG